MKMQRWVIGISLLLLLVYVNVFIVRKETLRKEGRLILLELAPADPRSLMQGDYMDLRYKLAADAPRGRMLRLGYCVLRTDPRGVVQEVRFQPHSQPRTAQEQLLKYTMPDSFSVCLGAASFFFQEGQAERYSKAKYGGLRVDVDGNSLLVGLYDAQGKLIK